MVDAIIDTWHVQNLVHVESKHPYIVRLASPRYVRYFMLFTKLIIGTYSADEPFHEAEGLSSFNQDHIFNYHQAKLAFALILFEMGDGIKEGDGEHLFEIYKLAPSLFKSNGHTKYSYAVLLYLPKINFILPGNEAFTLKWNRFYNHYGGKEKTFV